MTSPPISTRSTKGLVGLWPLLAAGLPLASLWSGPLPALARISFSAHMVLHLSLVGLAAPAAALGLARLGGNLRPPGGLALWAVASAGFELLVVWGWHLPVLHEAAALRPSFFAIQQAAFLVAGVLVWLPGVSGGGRRAAGAGSLALGLSFTHMTMLGVLLATAPTLLYQDGICGGAFGLDALADQRLGGVLMAVFGGAPYLVGTIVLAHRFIQGGLTRHTGGAA